MPDMTATRAEPMHVETDVLIIGSGGAGMYAAIEAARAGCSAFLVERSLIGRGGATVMAQMTVAVALGSQTQDHWSFHYNDTLEAGRGLCDERLARLLCEDGPARIREMDDWGIGWARKDGRIAQAFATTARAASMSTSSIPVRRCRRRCAPWSREPRASARPATSSSSISCAPATMSSARWRGISQPARRSPLRRRRQWLRPAG